MVMKVTRLGRHTSHQWDYTQQQKAQNYYDWSFHQLLYDKSGHWSQVSSRSTISFSFSEEVVARR